MQAFHMVTPVRHERAGCTLRPMNRRSYGMVAKNRMLELLLVSVFLRQKRRPPQSCCRSFGIELIDRPGGIDRHQRWALLNGRFLIGYGSPSFCPMFARRRGAETRAVATERFAI